MERIFTTQRMLLALLACGALLLGGVALLTQSRMADCKYVPLVAGELLPNADLAPDGQTRMPIGWARGVSRGVELRGSAISSNADEQGFDLDGNGVALQLIGIANYVETPRIAVQPGTSYCFNGRALTDSAKQSATRLQVVFHWLDSQGQPLDQSLSDWQPVVLWQPDTADWSTIRAAFSAPTGAAAFTVRLRPASDDRVYLDAMHVRRTIRGQEAPVRGRSTGVTVMPWPNGAKGAVAFTFDWETAMGGLVHSRSLNDDPNAANSDYIARGLAMRQGVTTTLALFRPHGIRATYYATGYNFLNGNAEQRQFMGNPTFDWARTDAGWQQAWNARPWFGDDPHSSTHTHPAWYFGDLIPLLQREQQDIQSHTFSHLYGGLARPDEWRADFAAWRDVAAARNVSPARSLAFPWSSSGGMSDANWHELERAGITSVTRTSWSLDQYDLFGRNKAGVPSQFDCTPVPGHETILACPDYYMHNDATAAVAHTLIDTVIAQGGMIDLWAHTEEVVSPAQIDNWRRVVDYAAQRRNAGDLWIAPLTEIADWQNTLRELSIENEELRNQGESRILTFKVSNVSKYTMNGLTLKLPFKVEKITVNGQLPNSQFSMLNSDTSILNLPAGASVEVQAWPA